MIIIFNLCCLRQKIRVNLPKIKQNSQELGASRKIDQKVGWCWTADTIIVVDEGRIWTRGNIHSVVIFC